MIEKKDSDFDQTVSSRDEPIMDVPILVLKDLQRDGTDTADQAIRQGMDLGCLWVDIGDGCDALQDTGVLWSHVESFFNTARDAPHWKSSRFTAPQDPYLDALMHSVYVSGSHYFSRPSFESSTIFPDDAASKAPECLADIDPLLFQVQNVMVDAANQIFAYIGERVLGIEADFLAAAPEKRTNTLTLHRVAPVAEEEEQKTAAQEHFDFNVANVLLYNYCRGFKIYRDKVWYQLAEPTKPNLLLFDFGSVVSIRSNRRVAALFHRVDSPILTEDERAAWGSRLSLVCPIVPALPQEIETHPKLLDESIDGGKSPFDRHTYRDHVFYASKHYTMLSKHVVFDDPNYNKAVSFQMRGAAFSVLRTKFRATWGSLFGQKAR
ncbi:predicted protein [Phaeodactylum tricornutum CCAP 1055/1]|jgi:hypothetical protein|uniref:Clavaminate synthase-like protein n=2 Tax=Phaeodactylum tricornutum TaxID=2850 RepID=B7G9V8_PHATC|nr:predicted protein [Phaeodactylum tricornutum CCAP 1055/1]EEC44511.1 predicted protein [Phaeodactylum tricornutum CCAP 1055/1]|eukprot:XP_002183842.1 predicted protein [Phaeodactylum tricornutum CCAP 1055/1]